MIQLFVDSPGIACYPDKADIYWLYTAIEGLLLEVG